jgi:methionyl-tRNA synthetase
VLATLAEGVRAVAVLLAPYMPEATAKLLGALGAPDIALSGSRLGAGELERIERLEPLFPKT